MPVKSGSKDPHFRIRSRLPEGDPWHDPVPLASDGHESFRPAALSLRDVHGRIKSGNGFPGLSGR